jgi:hypothetical protein
VQSTRRNNLGNMIDISRRNYQPDQLLRHPVGTLRLYVSIMFDREVRFESLNLMFDVSEEPQRHRVQVYTSLYMYTGLGLHPCTRK